MLWGLTIWFCLVCASLAKTISPALGISELPVLGLKPHKPSPLHVTTPMGVVLVLGSHVGESSWGSSSDISRDDLPVKFLFLWLFQMFCPYSAVTPPPPESEVQELHCGCISWNWAPAFCSLVSCGLLEPKFLWWGVRIIGTCWYKNRYSECSQVWYALKLAW